MRSSLRNPSRIAVVTVSCLSLLLASGCGNEADDEANDTGSTSESTPSEEPTEESTDEGTEESAEESTGEECTAADVTLESGAEFGEKPEVVLPDDCDPPSELVMEDLVEGTGPAAEEGGTVEANYLLVTWSNGEVLDNSFDRGETFPVTPLGQAQVIEGWNQGLIGMKEGGRRLLMIPPDLGYGAGGNGIEPNETLVFVVDAVSVS